MKKMKITGIRIITFILFFFFGVAPVIGQDIPSLPDTVKPPITLTLGCMGEATKASDMELCRIAAESARKATERYNTRITKYCNKLNNFDSVLRKKARNKRLEWEVYEELKVKINEILAECKPDEGDFFSVYHDRIDEYKNVMKLYKTKKRIIASGIRFD